MIVIFFKFTNFTKFKPGCREFSNCGIQKVMSHMNSGFSNNNNNNNNIQYNVHGAVIMAEPLREFTRFI